MLLAAGVLVLVCAAVLCVSRARRLDRLHVRVDAARAGLGSALARRADAAGRVAAVLAVTDPSPAAALWGAVLVARRPVPDREAAENTLGRQLAALDRRALPAGLLDELVEAEHLLALARRVHNDAVRDTLGLRSGRLVRWLHLAGTAPMPAYFEIADAEPGVTAAAPAHEAPVGPAG